MKLARFTSPKGPALAFYTGEHWLDLTRALQAYSMLTGKVPGDPITDMITLIEAGLLRADFLEDLRRFFERGEVSGEYYLDSEPKCEIPLRPRKIVCLGRNYAAHAAETGHEAPKEPVLFSKAPQACIANGAPIRIRPSYGRVDHEGEVALVIGRRAKDISEAEARGVVAGYTLINDVTARDMQQADFNQGLPWFRSKSIDTFCPIGPAVTPTDVISWPLELDLKVEVNGETRQSSNTRRFIFSVPAMLAYITKFMTLEPGDLVATGTPEGIAPLQSGDQVSVIAPELGALTNPVEEERDPA